MLNTLFGWYCRQNLGCNYDTITFTESIAASTTGYAVTLTNAQDGAAKKTKLNGYNFIVTDIYSVCTTGLVDMKVLPDNDTTTKFYIQAYQPLKRKLPVPLLLMSDLVIEFDNNDAHVNNVYTSFDGFWITESRMPTLTLLSEIIPTALGNTDIQTLGILNVLEATAASEGIEPPEEGWYSGPTLPTEYKEFCKRGDR